MNRRNLLAALLATPAMAQRRQTAMAEPAPSLDAPRRILLSMSEADPMRAMMVMNNLANIQRAYGQDMVQLAVVAYGPGLRHLLRQGSTIAERIASLRAYDVEFIACGATLETVGLPDEAVLEGVVVAPAGIPEIAERMLAGWIHVRP